MINVSNIPFSIKSNKPVDSFPKNQTVVKNNLDKLAQYGENNSNLLKICENKRKTNNSDLSKKQKNKALSKCVALKMINSNPNSELKKSYWNVYYCMEKIKYDPHSKKLNSRYCKNRACIICNRIRMSINIKEYAPIISSWNEVGFVTLSSVNCYQGQIKNQVTVYMETMELIKKQWNYKKKKELFSLGYSKNEYEMLKKNNPELVLFQALVKIEVTVNYIKNTFHPHLHLLVNGYDLSDFIVDKWVEILNKKGVTVSCEAQQSKPANSETVIEMMKYFTKIFQKDKDGNLYLPEKALDTILTELYRIPLYRAIGITKQERNFYKQKFVEQSEIFIELGNDKKSFIWVNNIFNWVDVETGETLCSTEIPIAILNYVKGNTNKIKY